MRRGDIVLAFVQGDYGKPRPVVIVQSDFLNANEPPSMLVCLMTTHERDAPLFRLTVAPSASNGLRNLSQIMVDKIVTLPYERIRERIGVLDDETLLSLNRALALVLGLAGA